MRFFAFRVATCITALAIFPSVGEARQTSTSPALKDLAAFLTPHGSGLEVKGASQSRWMSIGEITVSGCRLKLAPGDAANRPITLPLEEGIVARIPIQANVVFIDAMDPYGPSRTLLTLRKNGTPPDAAFHAALSDKLNAAIESCMK